MLEAAKQEVAEAHRKAERERSARASAKQSAAKAQREAERAKAGRALAEQAEAKRNAEQAEARKRKAAAKAAADMTKSVTKVLANAERMQAKAKAEKIKSNNLRKRVSHQKARVLKEIKTIQQPT